ncbi:hypothetical protein Bbelb_083380 [Branchiostoma belcheri]|nr:hypothetical protein Bbelb_083380 [Branchiostoma belcheri]
MQTLKHQFLLHSCGVCFKTARTAHARRVGQELLQTKPTTSGQYQPLLARDYRDKMDNNGWLVLLLVLLAETVSTVRSGHSQMQQQLFVRVFLSAGDLPTSLITSLSLQNNAFTTLNQSDFSRYSNLTTLRLQHNQISTINSGAIEAGTFNLPGLRTLNLYNNQLTRLRPDMFVGMDNLGSLDLRNNSVHSIEAGTFNLPGLNRTLNLNNNQLTSLRPDMFVGLDNLEGLYLSHNNIHSIEAGTFNLTGLRTLNLYNNQLTSLRPDMFVGLDSLGELDLHNNSIHSIEAGTFSNSRRLNRLELQNNNIVAIGSNILSHSPAYRYIYLSNNDINAFPVEAFSNLITKGYLNLDNNLMETLTPAAYDILASNDDGTVRINIEDNPWQCDCRMLPFKRRLTGFLAFEKTIRCEGPHHLEGKSLLVAVEPEDLICEEETSTGTTGATPPAGGSATDSSGPSPGFSLSVFLSGFFGVLVGALLASAVFLAIWCRKQETLQNQSYSCPSPDPGIHVTTKKARPDVTGTDTAV